MPDLDDKYSEFSREIGNDEPTQDNAAGAAKEPQPDFSDNADLYAVIELKVTELKKEHIGQIQVYMNYIDKNLKSINQNKTIGIIICKKENKYVIEYCSDNRIIAREYELI